MQTPSPSTPRRPSLSWRAAFVHLGALLPLAVLATGCNDAPRFAAVLPFADTHDDFGPYALEAHVEAPLGAQRVWAKVAAVPEGSAVEVDLTLDDGDLDLGRWSLELPGRPPGSGYAYYLALVDRAARHAYFPTSDDDNPPSDWLSFSVLP